MKFSHSGGGVNEIQLFRWWSDRRICHSVREIWFVFRVGHFYHQLSAICQCCYICTECLGSSFGMVSVNSVSLEKIRCPSKKYQLSITKDLFDLTTYKINCSALNLLLSFILYLAVWAHEATGIFATGSCSECGWCYQTYIFFRSLSSNFLEECGWYRHLCTSWNQRISSLYLWNTA